MAKELTMAAGPRSVPAHSTGSPPILAPTELYRMEIDQTAGTLSCRIFLREVLDLQMGVLTLDHTKDAPPFPISVPSSARPDR